MTPSAGLCIQSLRLSVQSRLFLLCQLDRIVFPSSAHPRPDGDKGEVDPPYHIETSVYHTRIIIETMYCIDHLTPFHISYGHISSALSTSPHPHILFITSADPRPVELPSYPGFTSSTRIFPFVCPVHHHLSTPLPPPPPNSKFVSPPHDQGDSNDNSSSQTSLVLR